MGKGLANPTAMILSAALMLDWLADRHGHAGAGAAARAIEAAVDRAFAAGLRPCEFGGGDGTAAIAARGAAGAAMPSQVIKPRTRPLLCGLCPATPTSGPRCGTRKSDHLRRRKHQHFCDWAFPIITPT